MESLFWKRYIVHCIYCRGKWKGKWKVRSMNQGKLEVVKQEMARVNIDILGISELKWTAMMSALGGQIFYSSGEGNLGVALESLQGKGMPSHLLWQL